MSWIEDSKSIGDEQPRTRGWTAIRDECVSGGALTDECNLVAAAHKVAEIDVVLQKLACGCILVPEDAEEIFL